MEAVASQYEELKNLGVEVLAMSTDTVFSHKVWKDISGAQKVEYPMLSDPTGEVAKAYGVYNEEEGLAQRGRFIIDPDGVIKAVEILVDPVGRNTKELIRQIKALQLNRETGEAAPAGWEPGGKTLKPSIELVGKI